MSAALKINPEPDDVQGTAIVINVFDGDDDDATGHNSRNMGDDIPLFTAQDATDAIAELKALKAAAKVETASIRRRIQIAELTLLIPAMHQAYTFRNSNFLVKLIKGAGLSGPIKRAVTMTISNLEKVVDGKLVFDADRTPLSHRSEKTGALLPVWDEARWAFLKQVYAVEVKQGLDPISDEWKDLFPSPEKTLSELQEAFATHIKGATKKGLSLQDMLAMIQTKINEGNIVE